MSWTLLGQGRVCGLGLRGYLSPSPWDSPPHVRGQGAPRLCIFPFRPPMAPEWIPTAPCGCQIGSRPLCGHLFAPPTPGGWPGGTYSSRPKQRALSRTPHPPRMSLMVPEQQCCTPPVPPA